MCSPNHLDQKLKVIRRLCPIGSASLRSGDARHFEHTEEFRGLCMKMLYKVLNEIRRHNPRTMSKGIETNVSK